MSEVVWVAIIGVAGTLIAGVVAPFVKDRIESRSRERAVNRAALATAIQSISQIFGQLGELRAGDPETQPLLWRLNEPVTTLELLVGKGEGEVAQLVSMATIFARRGETEHDEIVHRMSTMAVLTSLSRWYRGEVKAKGLVASYTKLIETMLVGLQDGTIHVVPSSNDQPAEGS